MSNASDIFVLYVPILRIADILTALSSDFVKSLVWGVEAIEVIGPGTEEFFNLVEQSPNHRALISGQFFLDKSSNLLQVSEGVFIAFLNPQDANAFLVQGWGKLPFRQSSCYLAIEAIDGEGFDIYFRSKELADRVAAQFGNAQWEDTAQYLV